MPCNMCTAHLRLITCESANFRPSRLETIGRTPQKDGTPPYHPEEIGVDPNLMSAGPVPQHLPTTLHRDSASAKVELRGT